MFRSKDGLGSVDSKAAVTGVVKDVVVILWQIRLTIHTLTGIVCDCGVDGDCVCDVVAIAISRS